MDTVLITGAGGMVGSHLIEYLYNKNKKVIGTYYKPTIDLKEIYGLAELVEADLRYPETLDKLIAQYMPDHIFHLAAQSYPTVSWERPYETIDINMKGTLAVFEAIKRLKALQPAYDPVVVVACSSAEYGETLEDLGEKKVYENAPLKPLHPYGVSKVGQDLLAYQYWRNDKIKVIRARIFNTTGVRKVNDVTSDLTRRAIKINKYEKENCLRVGNIETKRAILDVRDLVSALTLLAEKGTYGEVYNVSSAFAYGIKDIIKIIEKLMDTKFQLRVDTSLLRPTDEPVIIGDITKLVHDTGWSQMFTIEQTIDAMLQYWRKKL